MKTRKDALLALLEDTKGIEADKNDFWGEDVHKRAIALRESIKVALNEETRKTDSQYAQNMKYKAWNFKTKEMFSPKTLEEDQMTILSNGQFINVSSSSTRLSQIYPLNSMKPLFSVEKFDRNGNEIFEGDIVKISYPAGYSLYLVKFGEYDNKMHYEDRVSGNGWYVEEYQFSGTDKQVDKMICDISAITGKEDVLYKYFGVIGNIYENPELLVQR